ncbi:MAG: amidohydrolase family protein [Pseudobdellovibrio sp.]
MLIFVIFFTKKDTQKNNCIIITGGNYFDSKALTMQPNKKLFLENNSIIFENNASASCQTINLNKHYILPGLIDSHTHMLSADRQTVTTWKQALELSAVRPAMTRIYIGEKNSKDMLFSGFTTLRDLGNSGKFLDVALSNRINDLTTQGPDLIVSGPGLATLNTQINLNLNPEEYTVFDKNTDIVLLLKKYKNNNISWIKLYADNSNPNEIVDLSLLQSVINIAHQEGFKVAVHSTYQLSVDNALQATPDSIEHFSYAADFTKINITNKPYAVLTDFSLKTCQQSHVEENCDKTITDFKNRIKWLKQNNFSLVFGSDAVLDFTNKFKNRGEASINSLISLGELGLSNLEIILSATATAAEMLQLNTGKIATGQQADLVIYSTNPLDNLQALLRPVIIISNGKIICESQVECVL